MEPGVVRELVQIRGGRGADVDGEEVRVWPKGGQGGGVMIRRCFQRRDLRFAKIDADGMLGPKTQRAPFGEFGGDSYRAGVVETLAIDQRFVRDSAEHARRGITRLRMPRYAAQFNEAEPQSLPDGQRRRVF